jgi:hypothetical protein
MSSSTATDSASAGLAEGLDEKLHVQQQQQGQAEAASSSAAAEAEGPPHPSGLLLEQRFQLCRVVAEECVSDAELRNLLKHRPHPVAYDGFEPSGRMHIAQGVMKAINVNRLTQAGCTFKFWVADWFAQLNNKMGGDLKKIQTVGKYMVEVRARACTDPQACTRSSVLACMHANTHTHCSHCSDCRLAPLTECVDVRLRLRHASACTHAYAYAHTRTSIGISVCVYVCACVCVGVCFYICTWFFERVGSHTCNGK